MDEKAARHLSDRDLRLLSTADLLALIQADIQELDLVIGKRHPPAEQRSKRRGTRGFVEDLPAEAEAAAAEEPPPAFHTVVCCNYHMGDFPAIARVCCPFCGRWHVAGNFPLKK